MTIQAYLESNIWKPSSDGQWLEAPCTLITEGVHKGSHGAIFHAGHILEESTSKWQNIPLTLGHPQVDGQFVSITQSPEIFNQYQIGEVVSPYWDEQKKAIRAKVRIPANHPQKDRLMKLKEVSVGVFTEDTQVYGQWFGEDYQACSISHCPDHLALLPEGMVGACNFDSDGCGIRVNAYQELTDTIKSFKESVMTDEKLLPLGIHQKDEVITESELRELQEANILLPGFLNINPNRSKQGEQGYDEAPGLYPPGVE